jgi:uncharacterized repeat protein (TIGR01451 family)
MRKRRPSRGALRLALAVAAVLMVLVAPASGAEEDESCPTRGPRVCVSVSDTPATVSPSAVGSPRYISYEVVVANRAGNAVTHVTLSASLPAGAAFSSTTTSVGSCQVVGGKPTCALGKLASGGQAGVEIVATAPSTEGSASSSFAVSYDEGFNDGPQPDPKQDTVSTTEETSVAAVSGVASSFVPQGATVELSTEPGGTGVATPADPQFVAATITSAPSSVTASLAEAPGPLSCPKGVVCRGGDWMGATIPGTYDPPLAFELRWDKTLIPGGLNAKKFAVLVTECLDGCPIVVVSARCSSAAPPASELPCLWGVTRERDGDWLATLVNSHNGWMR